MRIQNIVNELGGERIDIIQWQDDPTKFVASALSPARVLNVSVDEASKTATVIVPESQLSLAIGKEGQNARLAAKLTGWRVDIKSDAAPRETVESAAPEHGDERPPVEAEPAEAVAAESVSPAVVAGAAGYSAPR
jgi:N utilization substance protein A